MKVKLIIEIYKCEFNTVKFKENRMFRTYILNEDDFSYSVPDIVTEPDCSRQPLIESLEFVIVQVPEGVDADELVEYDDRLNRVKWHKTVNLKMIDQKLVVAIQAIVEGYDLQMEYTITYVTEGPAFDEKPKETPDPIITFTE